MNRKRFQYAFVIVYHVCQPPEFNYIQLTRFRCSFSVDLENIVWIFDINELQIDFNLHNEALTTSAD